VRDLALSPDGGTAYSVSLDGSAIAWDLAGDDRLGRRFQADPVDPGGPVGGGCGACGDTTPDDGDVPPAVVPTTPGGKTFAIPGANGDVDLFDSTTLARTAVLPVNPGRRLFSVAIAPDGRTMAATTPFGEVALWDLRTRRPLAPLQSAHVGPVGTPTFGADGRLMATAGADGLVLLWDVHHRQSIGRIQQSLTVDDVGLSPDGKTLAVTTGARRGEGSVELYSVPRLILKARLAAPWGRWGRFSPDGRLFVVADHEGRLRRFDTRTWKPRSRPMSTGTSEVLSLAISGDGRTLAATSVGGGPRLWDLTSDRPTSEPLPGPQRLRSAAAFVRGATSLVIAYDDGRAVVWDLRPSAWAARACSEAGRTLTLGEWTDALPQQPYAPACRTR
jgi:WD40 repeat protein